MIRLWKSAPTPPDTSDLDRANEARRRAWYDTGYEDMGIGIGEPYTHADALKEAPNTSYTDVWVDLRNALIIELILGVVALAVVMYFVEAK